MGVSGTHLQPREKVTGAFVPPPPHPLRFLQSILTPLGGVGSQAGVVVINSLLIHETRGFQEPETLPYSKIAPPPPSRFLCHSSPDSPSARHWFSRWGKVLECRELDFHF